MKKPNVTVSQVRSILRARLPSAYITIEKQWVCQEQEKWVSWWINVVGVASSDIAQKSLQRAWETFKKAALKKGLEI